MRTLGPHVGSIDISQEPSFLSLTREGSILREVEDSQPMKDQDIQVEFEEPPGRTRATPPLGRCTPTP